MPLLSAWTHTVALCAPPGTGDFSRSSDTYSPKVTALARLSPTECMLLEVACGFCACLSLGAVPVGSPAIWGGLSELVP